MLLMRTRWREAGTPTFDSSPPTSESTIVVRVAEMPVIHPRQSQLQQEHVP